jgi:hypothetical protein
MIGHPRSSSAIRHLASCSFLQTAQQSKTPSSVVLTASSTKEGPDVIPEDVSCDPTRLNLTRRRRNVHKQKFNVLQAVPSGSDSSKCSTLPTTHLVRTPDEACRSHHQSRCCPENLIKPADPPALGPVSDPGRSEYVYRLWKQLPFRRVTAGNKCKYSRFGRIQDCLQQQV